MFDSTQGTPEQGPAVGIQCIVQVHSQAGRVILHSSDFYIYVAGQWFSVDWFGLLDWNLHRLNELEAVKAGRSIPDIEFQAILKAAQADPDFPRQSAKLP